MNPNDDNDQTPPASGGKPDLAGKLRRGNKLQESPQQQPDQPGAEYGGYGQADHAFGRGTGSSSDEGGQGGSKDAGINTEPVPKTRRGGSDGASQTRHSSNNDSQAQSAEVKQQDRNTPNQNHQDQGGQGNR